MNKIACYLFFILNTFSVYTWSTEFGFSFLDDDPHSTSLVSVPVVYPNPRYAFTAEEFDFFLQNAALSPLLLEERTGSSITM